MTEKIPNYPSLPPDDLKRTLTFAQPNTRHIPHPEQNYAFFAQQSETMEA
jgi:hypothetical protein